jgi:predicted metalloenzyme YecM
LKNLDVQTFVDKEFDLLISYYKLQHLELNVITAASKSRFKVGLSDEDTRFYDLIINCEPKDFDIFVIELNKYLTVLNKI